MSDNTGPLTYYSLPISVFVVSALQYSDYLRYIVDCAERYIVKHIHKGKETWANLRDKAHFVLGHPNGWEGAQQAHIRRIAVKAGLVPEPESRRISFVSEAEAATHFVTNNGERKLGLRVCGFVLLSSIMPMLSLSCDRSANTSSLPMLVEEL